MRFHEPERPRAEERPRVEPPRPRELDVLGLQRSAGNQAVTALLGRQPTETEAPPARATVSKIGIIPLLTFSSEQRQGHGARQPGIVCVSNVGGHSAKLQQFMADGMASDVEIVQTKSGFKLTLEQALISSYQTSAATEGGDPTETWTIDPGKASVDDGKGGGGGGGGGNPPWSDLPTPG